MKYRRLGSSGLRVSTIGLGSWLTVGNTIDQATTDRLIARARDLGINFLDTADVYNHGEAETALGRLIGRLHRPSLVLASKCFFPMSDDVNDRGLSRKHVHESLHGSLRRLRTDYLDLYQCHRPDPDTPLAETCMAMDDLIRQGKVLYWGVSEWPAHLISAAVLLCRSQGWHAPVSNQPLYNLFDRDIENQVMPVSEEHGVGQVVFSPLAQGVLSGKYRADLEPPSGTRAANPKINQFIGRYLTSERLAQVEGLVDLARRHELEPAQLALAWCLRLPTVSSVIVGATSVEQLETNASAADLALPTSLLEDLGDLFPV